MCLYAYTGGGPALPVRSLQAQGRRLFFTRFYIHYFALCILHYTRVICYTLYIHTHKYVIYYTLHYTHHTHYTHYIYTIYYMLQVSEDSLEKLHSTTSTTTIDHPNNNPPQTNGTTTGASSTRPKPNLKPPSSHSTTPTQTKTTSILYSLYRQQHLRVLIISSIILQMCQQLCGINAVFYYSTTFFEG